MFHPPKTRKEAEAYRYRRWAGQPNGQRYDPRYCAYEVHDGGRSPLFHQCSRKAGHGPDNIYCKQHSAYIEMEAGT